MPMKHRILLLSVFVLLALVSKAQTEKYRNTKAAIREHYAAAKAYIEQQRDVEAGGDIYPVTQCFSVQVKQNLPGTGYHQEDIKMYYYESRNMTNRYILTSI